MVERGSIPGSFAVLALVAVVGAGLAASATVPTATDIEHDPGAPAVAADAGREPVLDAAVGTETATVGDRIPLTLRLTIPPGWSFDARGVGPELGPFRVYDGAWSQDPEGSADGPTSWRWTGAIAGFETGELDLPAVRVRGSRPDGSAWSAATAPRTLRIESVLEDTGATDDREIADIKPPASIPPDWHALRLALGAVVALLALAGVVAWAHRRWSRRIGAGVPAPDPFDRMSPHEWAFRELQALLSDRTDDARMVDRFHERLARIVKTYLEGRYRVDLLERTTAESGAALRAAGAPEAATHETTSILEVCDGVKFAGDRPDPAACRATVDRAYRLIDATRPRETSREGAA